METKVEECELTPEIETALEHPTVSHSLPYLLNEVRSGISQLWRAKHGKHVLYVITRYHESDCKEWVICWVRGTGVKEIAPAFIEVARKRGWFLRIHVGNESRVRLFRRLGFVCDEYVMRFK